MPRYSTSIREKLAALRETRHGAIANIEKTVADVSHELDKQEARKAEPHDVPLALQTDIQRVLVVPAEPTDVERLRGMIEPVAEPLTKAGLVLILVIFMLLGREDLRDRIIRLVGQGRITLTTKTMDEAGHRVSRFLFTQSLINSGFGAIVTIGLLAIGIPYAILWGVIAGFLRFVPFLGSILAMLMPLALAFVGSEGWAPTVETFVLFVGMDLVTANIVEPFLIGTHTGVLSLALLISAVFWTWLWGPVGLLLSTPITVCLAVLGKYAPGLEFLAVLLSDEPPLATEVSFYQRLLASDEEEADEIFEQQRKAEAPEEVFDKILVPALLMAERDRVRDEISETERNFVVAAIRDILVSLPKSTAAVSAPEDTPGEAPPPGETRKKILAVPARNSGDDLVLEMLGQLLESSSCEVVPLTTATLASEVLLAVERERPDVLCIAAAPPGGLAHARYLCKRLRSRFPALRIWVLRPGARSDPTRVVSQLEEAGADKIAISFADVSAQLAQLLALGSSLDTSAVTAPIAADLRSEYFEVRANRRLLTG